MTSFEIRNLFIEFFKEKDHVELPSSSLIPRDDPTLLFTNAGMVQFKSIFLGNANAPSKRAVTAQKCLRAGGKHNDLENVGRTARHHTFFEMLGNFSFGDYFKKEAIEWAWEFLTQWLKLPTDSLWITVYEQDDEALELWHTIVGVPKERIAKLGAKDNFWQMGDTGPCGPCSEILIDQGVHVGCQRPSCSVGCDCDRFLELWNLVFMQYNRDSDGKLTSLPKPSIDTGMGLERLSAVLQGKTDNFESDLFMPIINEVEKLSRRSFHDGEKNRVSMKVIADHIRSATFTISEGLIPSNEGRSYVLRRIVRRAARHGFMLGIEEPFLYKLIDSVVAVLGGYYQQLNDGVETTKKALKAEEKQFIRTLSFGMGKIDELMGALKQNGSKIISGKDIFKLYDTFGFPIDLLEDIAKDNGFILDHKGFQVEMAEQKERARATWNVSADTAKAQGVFSQMLQKYGETHFVGYDRVEAEARLLGIYKDNAFVQQANPCDSIDLFLDQTPCYGESGGQVGDVGTAYFGDGTIDIIDTKKYDSLFVHKAIVKSGVPHVGMTLKVVIDKERRNAIKRNHTATHLLHAALKSTLGQHVKQAGSLVAPDKLRFDFSHFTSMKPEEIMEVEDMINDKILANMAVQVASMNIDEAVASGAVALFGEKYGETVRVVTAGDFSSELCGGAHCDSTGMIGPFKIVSEGSAASGIRRIEAITGFASINYLRQTENTLNDLTTLLKADSPKLLTDRVETLLKDYKTVQKELETLKAKAAAKGVESLVDQALEINNVKIIIQRLDGMDMKTLRTTVDRLKDLLRSGVIVMASVLDDKVSYVAVVTKEHTDKLKAGDILKEITQGKAGGRPDMAQGGTKEIDLVDKALAAVPALIEKMLAKA
jgi:alanyl-tRNA synthetase